MASLLKIDNEEYRAFVLIRKDANSSRLYVHEVVEMEKLQSLSKTEAGNPLIRATGVIRRIANEMYVSIKTTFRITITEKSLAESTISKDCQILTV